MHWHARLPSSAGQPLGGVGVGVGVCVAVLEHVRLADSDADRLKDRDWLQLSGERASFFHTQTMEIESGKNIVWQKRGCLRGRFNNFD